MGFIRTGKRPYGQRLALFLIFLSVLFTCSSIFIPWWKIDSTCNYHVNSREGSDYNNYHWSEELNPITNDIQETGYAPYAPDIGSHAFQFQGAGDAMVLDMHFQKPSTFVYLNILMDFSVIFELLLLIAVIQRGKMRWGNRVAAVVGILLLVIFLMSICLFISKTPSVMMEDAMLSSQNYGTSFIEPEHDFPTNHFEGSFEEKVVIYNGDFKVKQTWGAGSGLILLWLALITDLLVVAILMIGISKEKPPKPKPRRTRNVSKIPTPAIDQMPYPTPYFDATGLPGDGKLSKSDGNMKPPPPPDRKVMR